MDCSGPQVVQIPGPAGVEEVIVGDSMSVVASPVEAGPGGVDVEGSTGDSNDAMASYQESARFCTWRKHVRDLYQQLVHVDLVWEAPAAQLMPYVTTKEGVTTHTVMCGTRTGGQEQSFLQLLNVSMPCDTRVLDEVVMPYCEATGEVGGYGMSPSQAGLRVERRITHDGDVLAARYMYANPLIIGSASSNGNLYIFDWSLVSLNRYPNDPPRPRAPLPPNELSSNPTDEERLQFQRRMRELNAVVVEQDKWDRRRGEGQHVLKLVGGNGPSDNLDWSTSPDGVVVSGSRGTVCVWHVANLSKDDARTVEPTEVFSLDADEARITSVSFVWPSPHEFVCSTTDGSVFYNDIRGRSSSIIIPGGGVAMTSLAANPADPMSMLVGDGDGVVSVFDFRKASEPVFAEKLHAGEVTTTAWCPHSRGLFSTGGIDGNVCVFHLEAQKLLFKHAGHTDRIMDLGWNWQEDWAGQMISTDSHAVMMWRPRDAFFAP